MLRALFGVLRAQRHLLARSTCMDRLHRRLTSMGLMAPEPPEPPGWFEVFLSHFRAFKAEYGHTRVPVAYVCTDKHKLGGQMRSIRSGANKLTPEQRAVLDAEGFIWNASLYGAWWPEFIAHFRAFKAEFGHTRVPLAHVCADDYKLGLRVSGIRTGNNKVTDAQRAILEAEGFRWDASTTGTWWPEFVDRFRAYKAEKGHTKVPTKHVCPDGYQLGQKVGHIRCGAIQLAPEQTAILDAEGFVWVALTTGAWWVEFIEHFRAYKAENGHANVPRAHRCADGFRLGQQVGGIRSGSLKITDEQRTILDAEEFIWDASRKGTWWPVFIDHFRAYKAEHGHVQVPFSYSCPDDYKLGLKVSCIRAGNNKVTEEQRALLDAEGFVWNASLYGLWWPEFADHFRAFKAEHGHVKVPKNHVCADGYPLGDRVGSIRQGGNKVAPEQQAVLEGEGFLWRVRGQAVAA